MTICPSSGKYHGLERPALYIDGDENPVRYIDGDANDAIQAANITRTSVVEGVLTEETCSNSPLLATGGVLQ